MKKTYCDSCGKEIIPLYNEISFTPPNFTKVADFFQQPILRVRVENADLCEDCQLDIIKEKISTDAVR